MRQLELVPDNKPDSGNSFDEWWRIYPRKVAKREARRVFRRWITTEEQYTTLIENTKAWAAYWRETHRELEMIPYPKTFLNQGHYEQPPVSEKRISRAAESIAYWAKERERTG